MSANPQTPESVAHRPENRWLVPGLAGLGLTVGAFLALSPPIPQDPAYHAFADRRGWAGIPNFADVVSNLPFLLVGLFGAWRLPRSRAWTRLLPWERKAWVFLLLSLSSVAVGSAYYHWAPSTPRLFWDRLPMATTFMTFFALLLSDRSVVKRGALVWLVLLIVGLGSVLHWRQTEIAGKGDLRAYALVQFVPMITAPFLMALKRGRILRTSHLLGALAAYVLAKALEALDASIFERVVLVSGHSLKHVAAAVGSLFMVTALLSGGGHAER